MCKFQDGLSIQIFKNDIEPPNQFGDDPEAEIAQALMHLYYSSYDRDEIMTKSKVQECFSWSWEEITAAVEKHRKLLLEEDVRIEGILE